MSGVLVKYLSGPQSKKHKVGLDVRCCGNFSEVLSQSHPASALRKWQFLSLYDFKTFKVEKCGNVGLVTVIGEN